MFSKKWVKFSPAKIQLDIAWARFTLSGWQSYDGRSEQQISSFMISFRKTCSADNCRAWPNIDKIASFQKNNYDDIQLWDGHKTSNEMCWHLWSSLIEGEFSKANHFFQCWLHHFMTLLTATWVFSPQLPSQVPIKNRCKTKEYLSKTWQSWVGEEKLRFCKGRTIAVIPFVDILVEWPHSHILLHLVWWCVEFCCMLLFNQDLTPAVELACPHQLFQTRTCSRQVKGLSL